MTGCLHGVRMEQHAMLLAQLTNLSNRLYGSKFIVDPHNRNARRHSLRELQPLFHVIEIDDAILVHFDFSRDNEIAFCQRLKN